MTVTNTTECITQANSIADGQWVAKIRVASYMKAHPEDRRTPRDKFPLTVPVRHWAQVLGVTASEASMVLSHEDSTTPDKYGYVSIEQKWTLVSSKPFVVVHFRDHDEWKGEVAKLHRGVTTARQMHKGELGQRPELIRKPKILPSEIPDPNSDNGHWDNSDPCNPKFIRPNLNWVELSELADIVGITAEDIIRGFAGFSPSTWYEPNVPLLRGVSRLGESMIRVYVGEVPKSFCGGESQWGGSKAVPLSSLQSVIKDNPSGVWVPQSFAYNVIRLVQFGYQPDNETPERSFRLEAPMPTAPVTDMPVLSVEELRELHELRAELGEERPKAIFRLAAQNALDSRAWQKAREMDDTSQGFSYDVDFERLDFDGEDGNLVISTCFWTRAGASKSPNYYAGFLAVFPRRVSDPRRDSSAILRIWFWPGELLRVTPTGSKGGLCPSEVPSELAERVKRFLGELGYTV